MTSPNSDQVDEPGSKGTHDTSAEARSTDDERPDATPSERTRGGAEQPKDSLSLDALVDRIAERYKKDPKLASCAAAEIPALRRSFALLLPYLAPRYEPLDAFKPGGGGVPILCQDTHLRNQRCVLKIPRPVVGQEADLNLILAREVERMIEARHPHVIRTLIADQVPETETPFYIMEHVADAQDADEYLATTPTVDALIEVVSGAVTALAHVHQLNVVHTDVKPPNIFVDKSGRSLLADFGFAKRVDLPGETAIWGGTAGYMHPEQVSLMATVSHSKLDLDDSRRQVARQPLSRSLIKPYWDLYSLGMTLLVLITVVEDAKPKLRADYRIRYLRLMAYRLLGTNLSSAQVNSARVTPRPRIPDKILGLTAKDITELQYERMTDVLYDLQKLLGTRDLIREVPEVSRHPAEVIQASSHGPVPFTDRVRTIIDASEVRGLGTVAQLGLVSMVYPTATHSRLEHTLGTFSMASRYVRALYNDPINPIFKQIMGRVDIEAVLLACLVHDIGHYPLAHDLEEVSPKIFSHELRTIHLLTNTKVSGIAKLLKAGSSGWDVPVERVVTLLSAGNKPEAASFRDSVLSAIVDGPVDADKLDYLVRDGENLRLSYGRGIDHDRLVSSMTVVMIPRMKGKFEVERFPSIGIQDRGRIAAESLAFSRYAMYGSVYWHRTHRTLKAMLNQVAYEALSAASHDPVGRPRREATYVKDMRNSLYDLLDLSDQGRLGVFEEPAPERTRVAPTSRFLDAGTDRVLDWLASFNPKRTAKLVSDLRARRLYQRVLVTSEYRTNDLPWDAIRGVFGSRGERDGQVWARRHTLVNALQHEVASAVAKWDGVVRDDRTEIDPSMVDQFVAQAALRPVILVDYPIAKPGSKHALSFLHEAEWQDPSSDAFQAVAADESPIWGAVADQMQASLAKLRVYCDPTFAGLVSAAVSSDELMRLVAISLDTVD